MTAPEDGTTADVTPATRTATVRTDHECPEVVAAAVVPDNTEDMETRVGADAVVATIERGNAGGLQSSVDDYVVNVDVAETVAGLAAAFRRRTGEHRHEGTDTNG